MHERMRAKREPVDVAHADRDDASDARPVRRLVVGSASDHVEREADSLAAAALRRAAASSADRSSALPPAGSLPREPPIGTWPASGTRIRRMNAPSGGGPASAAGGPVPPALADRIQRARGAGSPLAPDVRNAAEGAFGARFGDVRVHAGDEAEVLRRQLGARAFTIGSDIFLPSDAVDGRSDGVLAHELAHVVQHRAGGTAETVHRKFGFEFELQIPVFSRGRNDEPAPPQRAGAVQLAEGDGFSVHVDHSTKVNITMPESGRERPGAGADPTAAILEIATDPLDETKLTETQVRQQIGKASTFAKDAHLRALRPSGGRNWKARLYSRRTLLDNVQNVEKATPRRTNYLGSGYAKVPRPVRTFGHISDAAYAQATLGVSLKSLPAYLDQEAGPESSIDDRYKTAMQSAASIGTTMASWMISERSGKRSNGGGLERELAGYFAAVAYYLKASEAVAQGEAAGGTLGKNLIGPYFLKTGLHTVRNQLKKKYKDAAKLLASRKADAIKTKLWQLTGRQPGQNFFPGRNSDFTCDAWLSGVLTGRQDLALAWKNPWSQELTEDRIGTGREAGIGVVIESRRLAAARGQPHKRYKPDEWQDLAVQVYWERIMLSGTDQQRLEAATKLGILDTSPQPGVVTGGGGQPGGNGGGPVPPPAPPPPPRT